MATIEQLHRVKTLHIPRIDKLPTLRRLSRDDKEPRSCALKEFRFPPPFTGKKKKKKKLPPIPEHAFPRQPTQESAGDIDVLHIADIHQLPALPEIKAVLTDTPRSDVTNTHTKDDDIDSRSDGGNPSATFGCVREFTFPVSSAKRKRESLAHFKTKEKDTPLQAKIEKLARKKRKAKKATDRKEVKKQQINELKFPALQKTEAFRARKDRESNTFSMKESRVSSFRNVVKQDESEKPRVPPRLYTRIVDSIYAYSRGISNDTDDSLDGRREPIERLPVTPVTVKDDKDDYVLRTSQFFFPPLT